MSQYIDAAGNVREIADDLYAAWVAAKNPKALAWSLAPGPTPEQLAAQQAAQAQEAEADRISTLWQAAHDLEYSQISGSAVGLLAMGVMLGKPKCLAVQAWIKSIWTEYYTRRAMGSSDTDYGFAGPIPHSVPELMAELGV